MAKGRQVKGCDMATCDPEVVATLARFEQKWVQQEKCNDKIDDIHKIICGNGDEGIVDKVRVLENFRLSVKKHMTKLLWLLASGSIIGVIGLIFGAIF